MKSLPFLFNINMEGLRLGTKLYRWRYNNNTLETVIFKKIEDGMFIIQTENGEDKRLSEWNFNLKYCLSKLMVLTEAEEIMRLDLLNIQSVLRDMKAGFDPLRKMDIIISPSYNPGKEVHQYHITSGRYIDSFNSVSEAAKSLGKTRGNISKACNNERGNAYGYKWSYEKVNFLR